MSVAIDLKQWMFADDSSFVTRHRASVRAHLGMFVRGEPIDDLDFMKRVEDRRPRRSRFSHGVWSIRPSFLPQTRLFGFFAITNWFVILSQQSRDYLEKSEAHWHDEIDSCERSWSVMFPARDPWVRDELRQYMSNAEKRDDRW